MKATMGRILIGTAVVVACASAAFGGPWSEPGGSAAGFTYDSGGDLNGLFGEPWVPMGQNTFYFTDSMFQVNAASGQTDTQSDTVSFNVRANPGLQFAEMHVTASGSYSVGGAGSSVDVDAGMALHELEGLGRTWSEPLVTSPTFPIEFGSGDWEGDILVNVAWEFPTPDDYVNVSLSNILEAVAGVGGGAEVNVQYQDLQISFTLIPEPATLALLAVGGLVALARRRG